MKRSRNLIRKLSIVLIMIILYFVIYIDDSNATNEIEKYLENSNIDVNSITQQEILDVYEDFAENYSTNEMIGLLDKNKEKLQEQGISESTIETGKQILETTDEEEIKQIIKENVDINEIQEKIEKGYTTEQIITSIIEEMPTEQKINVTGRLILSNRIIKNIIVILIILFIYCTILRAIIYNKSGKKWFAAFIPIYRQVTMYRICDLSLGYMCLWFIPIIGWFILFFIAIMKRIYLSQKFGKGLLFGIGLVILPPIFQSILAFNKNFTVETKVT